MVWNRIINDIDWLIDYREISNLVVIGGDGSLTGANRFRQEWTSLLKVNAGLYIVPYNFIFFPIPSFFFFLIFFPKICVPFPLTQLYILPNSLNIIGKMILLPLSLFSMLYSSPQPWYSSAIISISFPIITCRVDIFSSKLNWRLFS